MTTYAKLEVNPAGDILQSSYVVPADGVLPNPQRTYNTIESTKGYSQSVFPAYVTVALEGNSAGSRIVALYFPPHLAGLGNLILLAPLGAVALTIYGIAGLLMINTTLDVLHLTGIALSAFIVSLIVVILPSWAWSKWLYYQGAPSYRLQRKVQQKYPNIPVYHDKASFLLDIDK